MLKHASAEVQQVFNTFESELTDPVTLSSKLQDAFAAVLAKYPVSSAKHDAKEQSKPIGGVSGLTGVSGSESKSTLPNVLSLELGVYVARLQEVCANVLLRQIGALYSSFSLHRFLRLVPFMTRYVVEKLVLDAARTLELPVRIDHQVDCLRFVDNLSIISSTSPPAISTLTQRTPLSYFL